MNLMECKGDWALVTGASAGIGREFCVQLGRAGMNLVLVARRTHLLESLAAELQHAFGVKTLVISAVIPANRCDRSQSTRCIGGHKTEAALQ